MNTERVNFGSRLGIILATAGSAVGLGNVWRFPYMAGENGGAAFIIVYLACVLLLGIPCIMAEFIIGRRAQANAARAYRMLANGTAWKWIGYMGILTGTIIISYYVVVSGWCLEYIYASVAGRLQGDIGYVQKYFADFSQNPWKPVLWVVLFFAMTHVVIVMGVEKGIERASKILMPTLFVLLLVIVAASCSLPGARKGIDFLLHPDFSKVTRDVFLGALGQSFYSMSIGMGCLCTYASYFSRDTHLTKSAVQISLIDTCVAILAGMMIFPAAFSVGINPDSGPALVFITLPNVFNQAFASLPLLGSVIAVMFYSLLSLAALTSLISLHEVITAFLHEELNLTRHRAALLVTVGCTVVAIFCSLSLGGCEGLAIAGTSLFDVFDFVSGQLLLPLGGFLTALFLGWYVDKRIVRDEFTNGGTLSSRFFGVFMFCLRYVCPIGILLIFLHQFNVI